MCGCNNFKYIYIYYKLQIHYFLDIKKSSSIRCDTGSMIKEWKFGLKNLFKEIEEYVIL